MSQYPDPSEAQQYAPYTNGSATYEQYHQPVAPVAPLAPIYATASQGLTATDHKPIPQPDAGDGAAKDKSNRLRKACDSCSVRKVKVSLSRISDIY